MIAGSSIAATCGSRREMRHRDNADKLARETAYFEETGRDYYYDHKEEHR